MVCITVIKTVQNTCVYIYIYICIFVYCSVQRVVLVAVRQAVQRREVRERDRAGKLSQAVRSVYTDHMTQDTINTFSTMIHARTHARTHTHTHMGQPRSNLIISCATLDLSELEGICH